MLNILIDVKPQPQALEKLRAMPDVKLHFIGPETPAGVEQSPELLASIDILFTTFLPKNHDHLTRLKYVQIGSAGYEQLRGARLQQRGVTACNASGVFDTAIAEWNIMMMIALRRNLRQMIRNQDAARWDPADEFQTQIMGGTVGLWGYGGLARQTARLCKAMGLAVHVLTRDGQVKPFINRYVVPGTGDPEGELPDRVFSHAQRFEFLKGVDYLVLAMPLNDSTRGLIGEAELRALPHTAYLLNPARGPLVQEAALVSALKEKWFAGAALDTHYYYPMPPDHPMWKFEQVIFTPHISGSAGGEYYPRRLWDIFMQNLDRFRKGQPLLNELNID
jgi:phosphoglycerate dehydrogenase-like enzyme